jgi:hypothetical protein
MDAREALYAEMKASGQMSTEALRRWRVAQRLVPDPDLPAPASIAAPTTPQNVSLERPIIAPRRTARRRTTKISRPSFDLSARWDLEV